MEPITYAQYALAAFLIWPILRHVIRPVVVRTSKIINRRRRDPQRTLSRKLRHQVRAHSGDQCEHKPILWRRCIDPAEQIDHIWPWSQRGATSIANSQGLCAHHNLAKSDKRPGWFYRWRLRRRRRRYHPINPPLSVRHLRY